MHSYAVGVRETIPLSGELRQGSAAASRRSSERAALFCSAGSIPPLPLHIAPCDSKHTASPVKPAALLYDK